LLRTRGDERASTISGSSMTRNAIDVARRGEPRVSSSTLTAQIDTISVLWGGACLGTDAAHVSSTLAESSS
jgi:hypothetical protein